MEKKERVRKKFSRGLNFLCIYLALILIKKKLMGKSIRLLGTLGRRRKRRPSSLLVLNLCGSFRVITELSFQKNKKFLSQQKFVVWKSFGNP